MNIPPQMLAALMQKFGAVGAGGTPTSASTPFNGGGGIGGISYPGSNNAQQNLAAGATPQGNAAGLASEGSLQAGQTTMANPQMSDADRAMDAYTTLTDVTRGVGPPAGTAGYGTATMGQVGNPALGPGSDGNGAFDVGGTASEGATIPTSQASGSVGPDVGTLLNNLMAQRGELPRQPAKNSLNLSSIFPQTGLQPYRGPLG